MRIGKYLNTTEEGVLGRNYNIFFGISLGNKYFTPDTIRSYIRWSVEHTKEKVIVLIPDKIQAINYEVKNEYSPKRALAVAMRKGLEIEKIVNQQIAELQVPASKIRVLHWSDIEDASYTKTLALIQTAFKGDSVFREFVVQMVKKTNHLASLKLTDSQYEKLAQYIVNELPVLINGLQVGGKYYGLFPYPGFAELDYLAIDLQEGRSFPELTRQLNIKNKLRLVELYAD